MNEFLLMTKEELEELEGIIVNSEPIESDLNYHSWTHYLADIRLALSNR
ncbi:MAG: hypothetical protein RSF40_01620 [Oscillospiraceae bacterium]